MKLDLTIAEVGALKYLLDNHFRFPVALPTGNDKAQEPHIDNLAAKVGVQQNRSKRKMSTSLGKTKQDIVEGMIEDTIESITMEGVPLDDAMNAMLDKALELAYCVTGTEEATRNAVDMMMNSKAAEWRDDIDEAECCGDGCCGDGCHTEESA